MLLALLFSMAALADEPSAPIPPPPKDNVLTNESEAGIVITAGNSDTQSYNLKSTWTYEFSGNQFILSGHYLQSISKGVTFSRNWDINLRYERDLLWKIRAYVAQSLEGDVFAGYTQRYNTDVGGKYQIFKQEDFYWNAETGYRYSSQNTLDGLSQDSHFLRLFSEISRSWDKNFALKYQLEVLPNLSVATAYRITTAISLSSILTSVFSVKTTYSLRYNHQPALASLKQADSSLSTALVAKF